MTYGMSLPKNPVIRFAPYGLLAISDVATDPNSVSSAGRGGRTVVEGTRDGVDIKVIIGKDGG